MDRALYWSPGRRQPHKGGRILRRHLPDTYADTNSDAYADTNAYADTYADTNADADTYADTYAGDARSAFNIA